MEPFPVKSVTALTAQSGVSLVVHSYSNRYFVIISEAGVSGSLGTIIQVVKHEQGSSNGCDFDAVGPSQAVYDISWKFGTETPELLLAARILASRVDFDKPVLFGLALRKEKINKELLTEVSQELIRLIKSVS